MAKVSVIVPTYNRSKYLKETLQSILKQDFKDYEIIVSDNASTDDTEAIVASFNDHRIVYHKNEVNVGSVKNYNVALRICKGTYIHLFSDDDVMLPGCISAKVDVLDNHPEVGFVHSNVNVIDGDGNISSDSHYSFKVYKMLRNLHAQSRMFEKEAYHKYLWADNIVCMPAVMMRRDVYDKIGVFDPELSFIVDWQYWLKATLFFNVYYINQVLMSYRVHATNTVKQLSIKIMEEELTHIKKDLASRYSKHLIVKNWLGRAAIQLYYKGRYKHFYGYQLKKLMLKLKSQ